MMGLISEAPTRLQKLGSALRVSPLGSQLIGFLPALALRKFRSFSWSENIVYPEFGRSENLLFPKLRGFKKNRAGLMRNIQVPRC